MNNYQKIIIIVAGINIGLMLLFPPVLDAPLYRGAPPGFGGFLPVYALGGGRMPHTELLTLQLLFVVANALAAYLAVGAASQGPSSPTPGIAAFVIANLLVIFLFAPFETYGSVPRPAVATFDGFYFVFGEHARRAVFAPLLYLETVFVVVNALLIWLLFSVLGKGASPDRADPSMAPSGGVPAAEQARSSPAPRNAAGRDASSRNNARDRRMDRDLDYTGSDRRLGPERRQRPR
jgi:hypothetical protein